MTFSRRLLLVQFCLFLSRRCTVTAMYPDAQKKAQTELDAVVGDRLADFEDLDSLQYINAVIKETLRWQHVTPIGEFSTEAVHRCQLNICA